LRASSKVVGRSRGPPERSYIASGDPNFTSGVILVTPPAWSPRRRYSAGHALLPGGKRSHPAPSEYLVNLLRADTPTRVCHRSRMPPIATSEPCQARSRKNSPFCCTPAQKRFCDHDV
jgi:hypothetical protein